MLVLLLKIIKCELYWNYWLVICDADYRYVKYLCNVDLKGNIDNLSVDVVTILPSVMLIIVSDVLL